MEIDVKELQQIVGENNVRNDPADLFVYGSDSSVHRAAASIVVRATNIEQVQKVTRYGATFLHFLKTIVHLNYQYNLMVKIKAN